MKILKSLYSACSHFTAPCGALFLCLGKRLRLAHFSVQNPRTFWLPALFSDLPQPFHVSLPGYEPRLCKYALAKTDKAPRDPLLGPDISIFPPTWIPYWKPDPNFKPQNYNFNCKRITWASPRHCSEFS